jgi:hypothetical protein
MDYVDKLIPFAILGAVAAFVFFLLRRATQDRAVGNRSEDSRMLDEVRPEPRNVEQPIVAMGQKPVVIAMRESSPQQKSAIPLGGASTRDDEDEVPANSETAEPPPQGPMTTKRPKRKKRAPTPVVAPPTAPMSIVTVFGLLKEKNSLAAAFLLHEILAPPVARRH